jgi:hypothetical protein
MSVVPSDQVLLARACDAIFAREALSEATSRTRLALVFVALPLALGVAMYALFGRGMERQLHALDVVGVGALVSSLRVVTVPTGGHLPDAIRFHFADAAWGWALGAALSLVWADAPGARRTGWFVVGALFVVGTEVAQLVGLMPGTFDPVDIIVSILAYATAWRLVSRAVLRSEVPSHV